MLYPRESESREVKELSGVWQFRIDRHDEGRKKRWFAAPLRETIPMPVPASYNDVTQDAAIRDHIGDAWYERTFFVPAKWRDRRVVLRVGSASHPAVLWVDGRQVARHKGGFLPFEADVTDSVQYGAENRVTVVVNNLLDWTTLPPGQVVRKGKPYPPGYKTQEYHHDFFNYAGIHRPVRLYTTPPVFIEDITVVTDVKGKTGLVGYTVRLGGGKGALQVRLLDQAGREVARGAGAKGRLTVRDARLWQPGKAYLYTLEVRSRANGDAGEDVYRLPVGIRTVKVSGRKFLINGRPFYFKGFGKHEDADLRGKGHDDVTNVKDFNLLRWIGANSFRTSHYPYSEEIMQLADREGIVVIDEAPAVGMNFFSDFGVDSGAVFAKGRIDNRTLDHHLDVMRELIARDKNHPCVVLWSVANEARTADVGAVPYFRKVAAVTRQLDPTRPVGIVQITEVAKDRVGQFFDVIGVNRYYAWYTNPGHIDVVANLLAPDLEAWYRKYKKPVLLSEYGADTISGFHADPPVMFSEEYQTEFLRAYHAVLDKLDFIIGEHVWNFADFMTKQGKTRIIGNRKGVFTRQRQPKAAAFLLRERWTATGPAGRP